MPDLNDEPSLGCLSYLAAHCLTTYALSLLIPGVVKFPLVIVALAPVILPSVWFFGLVMAGHFICEHLR